MGFSSQASAAYQNNNTNTNGLGEAFMNHSYNSKNRTIIEMLQKELTH
ncbi:MAG: hypothetical protein ACI91R_002297, partial [Vicingaceae bacterium]